MATLLPLPCSSEPFERPALGPSRTRRGLVVITWAVLLGWHGWLTLTLFGPADPRPGHDEGPWHCLVDDQPVVSGRHPLHLYHGMLGANAVLGQWNACCYDPAYQAGYPKTPLFDSGSRPAEVFLAVAGGGYKPAAYKIGLAVCCFVAPLLIAVAAWAVGCRRGRTLVAGMLGLLVWWSSPCRALLEAGDLHLLIASHLAVLRIALLVPFHRSPGIGCWLGLVLCGAAGWLVHPFLTLGLVVIDLVYYVSTGARRSIGWHLALLTALFGGPALNSPWLFDWLDHWWIITPRMLTASLLPHRTPHTVWDAALWGNFADRLLAAGLLTAGTVGGVMWTMNKQRAAARVFATGALGACLLALAGLIWEPASRLSTDRLFVLGLLFAVLPAAHAVGGALDALRRTAARRPRLAVGLAASASTVVLAAGISPALTPGFAELWPRFGFARPFRIGLSPSEVAIVAALRTHTNSDCRILWEDRGTADDNRWTPLLGPLTGRAYLGGLDLDGVLEHAYAGLVGQVLAERPIGEWTDEELDEFCRRYNVGWVVCRTPATAARFTAWTAAYRTASIPTDVPGLCPNAELFTLHPGSYFLKGDGKVIRADSERITLADVVPDQGRVVLSFHYQAGMTVTPSRVQVEREPDANDPIPFIRLRMTGPVSRVTLRWSNR